MILCGTFSGDCRLESHDFITIVVNPKVNDGHLGSGTGAVRVTV